MWPPTETSEIVTAAVPTVTAKSPVAGTEPSSSASSNVRTIRDRAGPVPVCWATAPPTRFGGTMSSTADTGKELNDSAGGMPLRGLRSGSTSGFVYDTVARSSARTASARFTVTDLGPRTVLPVPGRLRTLPSASSAATRNALPAGADVWSSVPSKVSRSVSRTTVASTGEGPASPSVSFVTARSLNCGARLPSVSRSSSSL